MLNLGSAVLTEMDGGKYVEVAWYNFTFDWELVSQDVEANASTISWTLYGDYSTSKTGSYFDTSMLYSAAIQIGSADASTNVYDRYDGSNLLMNRGNNVLLTGTTVIYHSSTSTQNFKVRLTGGRSSGNLYFGGNWTGNLSGNYNTFQTDTLDYIVRRAYFTDSVPNFDDESGVTISYSNPAGNYATLLQAGISLTKVDTSMAIPYRNISKTGTSYKFSFSSSELTTLYKVLDNYGNNVEVKVPVRVFLKSTVPTLNNSTETITDYRDCTLTFINFKPTLNVTLKDVNSISKRVTGSENIFVNYVSEVQFNLGATAHKGATIDANRSYINNGDTPINALTGSFNPITGDTFTVQVWDNRGNFETWIKTYSFDDGNFVEYFPLTVRAKNTPLDSHGSLDVTVSGKYFQGHFGAMDNSLKLEYLINVSGQDTASWVRVPNVVPTVDSDGNYTFTFPIDGLDYTSRYDLSVRATDEIMQVETATPIIVAAQPLFDWGASDFKFYIPVTILDGVVPAIVEQGTYGNWTYRKWADGIAECWMTKEVSATSSNTTAVGWYSSGELTSTNIDFPFTFAARPTVTTSIMPTGATWAILFPSNTSGSTTKTGSYQLMTTSKIDTAKTYHIAYQVRGKWK